MFCGLVPTMRPMLLFALGSSLILALAQTSSHLSLLTILRFYTCCTAYCYSTITEDLVVLKTDDFEPEANLRQKQFGTSNCMHNFYSYPNFSFIGSGYVNRYKQLDIKFKTNYGSRRNELKAIVTDLHFLSKCPYVVCTFSSNVSIY